MAAAGTQGKEQQLHRLSCALPPQHGLLPAWLDKRCGQVSEKQVPSQTCHLAMQSPAQALACSFCPGLVRATRSPESLQPCVQACDSYRPQSVQSHTWVPGKRPVRTACETESCTSAASLCGWQAVQWLAKCTQGCKGSRRTEQGSRCCHTIEGATCHTGSRVLLMLFQPAGLLSWYANEPS